jgi:hypothetical protein
MKASHRVCVYAVFTAAFLAGSRSCAERGDGAPDRPGATTTITRQYLPTSPSAFGGVIDTEAPDYNPRCLRPRRLGPAVWVTAATVSSQRVVPLRHDCARFRHYSNGRSV